MEKILVDALKEIASQYQDAAILMTIARKALADYDRITRARVARGQAV